MPPAKDRKAPSYNGAVGRPTGSGSLHSIIENSAVIIYGGVAISAFLAGLAAYQGILKLTNRETVPRGSYTLKADIAKATGEPPAAADPAALTIEHFYDLLNGKKFEDAWALLHPNRRAAIQKVIPDAEAFARRYGTTQSHENIRVELAQRNLITSSYWVSFDVKDTLPKSDFYEMQDRLVGDLFDEGALNKERTLRVVRANLGTYYDTSGLTDDTLNNMVSNCRVQVLFSPLFITELELALHLPERPNFIATPKRDVWRHFILEVKMQQDDGAWKIADGLYPPAAVGFYGAGARIPAK